MTKRQAILRSAMAGSLMLLAGLAATPQASAQTQAPAVTQPRATDLSSQERRPPRRLRIYPRNNPDEVSPRFNPGPNAVRDCTATYVQEYRPSGTVIVPRMSCYWRRG